MNLGFCRPYKGQYKTVFNTKENASNIERNTSYISNTSEFEQIISFSLILQKSSLNASVPNHWNNTFTVPSDHCSSSVFLSVFLVQMSQNS